MLQLVKINNYQLIVLQFIFLFLYQLSCRKTYYCENTGKATEGFGVLDEQQKAHWYKQFQVFLLKENPNFSVAKVRIPYSVRMVPNHSNCKRHSTSFFERNNVHRKFRSSRICRQSIGSRPQLLQAYFFDYTTEQLIISVHIHNKRRLDYS